MTRLDASSGEPSMEDILASIRRIIAEDPPGSRPAPQPTQRPASAAPQSSFGRLSSRDSQFEPAPAPAASVTPEPYLRASPAKLEPALFAPAPFFPAGSAPAAGPSRIEPSFAPMRSSSFIPVQPVTAPTQAALSVDAQLSELLGDIVPTQPEAEAHAPSAEPVAAETAQPTAAVDDLDGGYMDGLNVYPAANVASTDADDKPAESEQRPGFTVSRDGFMPAQANAATERDRFDFDLGPSPFEMKSSEPQPMQGAAPGDFGGFVPARDFGLAPASPALNSSRAVAPAPDFAAEMQAEMQQDDVCDIRIAAPSVAATLALPIDNPIDNIESAAEAAAPKPVERDVIEVFTADDATTAADVQPTGTAPNAVAVSDVANAHIADAAQRSMEDTVADLLRPMLKTWLAENMPLIVERALRREITEQMLSEHKSAAE